MLNYHVRVDVFFVAKIKPCQRAVLCRCVCIALVSACMCVCFTWNRERTFYAMSTHKNVNKRIYLNSFAYLFANSHTATTH